MWVDAGLCICWTFSVWSFQTSNRFRGLVVCACEAIGSWSVAFPCEKDTGDRAASSWWQSNTKPTLTCRIVFQHRVPGDCWGKWNLRLHLAWRVRCSWYSKVGNSSFYCDKLPFESKWNLLNLDFEEYVPGGPRIEMYVCRIIPVLGWLSLVAPRAVTSGVNDQDLVLSTLYQTYPLSFQPDWWRMYTRCWYTRWLSLYFSDD